MLSAAGVKPAPLAPHGRVEDAQLPVGVTRALQPPLLTGAPVRVEVGRLEKIEHRLSLAEGVVKMTAGFRDLDSTPGFRRVLWLGWNQ